MHITFDMWFYFNTMEPRSDLSGADGFVDFFNGIITFTKVT